MMLVDVRDILKSSGLSKTVELECSAGGCDIAELDGECAFMDLFDVRAVLSNIKGIIRAKGTVKTVYITHCARCLKTLRVDLYKEFDDEFVQYGTLGPVSAEDAEVYEYSDKEIDIGLAVRDAVLLGVPIRHLCGEDCLSLCQICGMDLNDGLCGCEQPSGDIRLAALGAYFENNPQA